jgi:hypothetical protein
MPRVASPAPAATGDVIRVITAVLADNEMAEFGLDYMSNSFSASPATDMGFLLAAFAAANAPSIKAALPADATLQSFTGVMLSRSDIATETTTFGSGVGGIAGNHLDKELAASLLKQTTLKGAHGRGRLLFGPLSTTLVTPATDANRLNASALTAFNGLCALLAGPLTIAGGSGATFSPCVSTRPPLGSSVVTKAMPLVRMVVNPIIATAKRRRVGRGV